MNMERLFNSPLTEGYDSIDGLNYNVTVIVIFPPSTVLDSLFHVWLIENCSVASDGNRRRKERREML